MRKLLPVFLVSLVFFLILAIFVFRSESTKPNIILISIDTLRQDHVGIYGYKRNTTPTIDDIAREGIYFKNAVSAAPWTLPAHMSMLTGLPPSIHSIENHTNKLSKDIQIVAELFKAQKYKTAGIITLPFVSAKYGFSKGFDEYVQRVTRKSKKVTDYVLNWLQNNKNQRFFLFIHFCDVHLAYGPPVEYAKMFGVDTTKDSWRYYGRFMFLKKFFDPAIPMPKNVKKNMIGLYDGEIRSVDFNISRLIKFLERENIYDNTILVITSDHGEEFKEHNSLGHAHTFYAEVINVPLIIRFPGKIRGGLKVNEPVITSDIPLTLLNMAKIKAPHQFKKYSVDLGSYFNRSSLKKNPNRELLVETTSNGPKRLAIIKNGYKYIAPFKFHPRKMEHKWIQIPESIYNMFKDTKDLKNLVRSPSPGKEVSFIQKNLKSALSRYVRKNVKGIKLVFSTAKNSSGDSINYRGYVQFVHEPGVLPFGIDFSDQDFLDTAEIDGRFKFNIFVKSSSKRIYLPISNKTEEIIIEIHQDGHMLVKKSLKPPELKEVILLLPDLENRGKIYLEGGILDTSAGKLTLSEKEKKQLETLGYL
jgi:arylsulfatase A-like enzyme